MAVTIECTYHLSLNGKRIAMTRAEMSSLRDQISGVLNGSATPAESTRLGDWTPQEDARMREMIGRGKPFSKIAEEIGRTEAACGVRWSKIKNVPSTRGSEFTA